MDYLKAVKTMLPKPTPVVYADNEVESQEIEEVDRGDEYYVYKTILSAFIADGDFTIVLSNGREIRRNSTLLRTFIPYFKQLFDEGMREAREMKCSFPDFAPEVIEFVLDNAISWYIDTSIHESLDYWLQLYQLFHFFGMKKQLEKLSEPIMRHFEMMAPSILKKDQTIVHIDLKELPDCIKVDFKDAIVACDLYKDNPWFLQVDSVFNDVNLQKLWKEDEESNLYREKLQRDSFMQALYVVFPVNKHTGKRRSIYDDKYKEKYVHQKLMPFNQVAFFRLVETRFDRFILEMSLDKIKTANEFVTKFKTLYKVQ